MEKISGIIPSNARTRSVDVSNSQPVRPGAPAWGRPMGRVTQAAQSMTPEDRVSMSAADALENSKAPIYNNKAEVSRTKIVDDLARKFFEGQATKEEINGRPEKLSEERLESFNQSREVGRPTE